jgi:membrane protein insertase Oxa1/YidC/SpoIIIJ
MEGPQAQVMKLMPLMIVALFFIWPIPAGALLYLLVTTVLMCLQTVYVHWQDNRKKDSVNLKKPPSDRIIDIKPDNA